MNPDVHAQSGSSGLSREPVSGILEAIERAVYRCRRAGRTPRAVFDLDHTLLDGDIGEAVHARLLLEGEGTPLRWEEYERLLAHDPALAFRRAAESLAGLKPSRVQEVARELLLRPGGRLRLESRTIPLPRPHPVMREVIDGMRVLGVDWFVLTASGQIQAETAVETLYDAPRSRVIGLRSGVKDGVLTRHLVPPYPIGHGKPVAFRQMVSSLPPVVGAGDSLLDIPMLKLVHPNGVCLWRGVTDVPLLRRALSPRDFLPVPSISRFNLQNKAC